MSGTIQQPDHESDPLLIVIGDEGTASRTPAASSSPVLGTPPHEDPSRWRAGSPPPPSTAESKVKRTNSSGSLAAEGPKSPRQPFIPNRKSDAQLFHKVKLYARLGVSTGGVVVPSHILPDELFAVPLFGAHVNKGGQKSWQTIFSIWNTMMGTSLLSMPWGYRQAGWAGGLGLTFFLGFITYYTSYLILIHSKGFEDFSDVCQQHLGRTGYTLSLLASLAILIGAVLALDIIMSGCLFSVGEFLRRSITGTSAPSPNWQPHYAPLVLAGMIFPLLMLKDISVLVKINSFGVISLMYLLFFLVYSFSEAGWAMEDTVPVAPTIIYLAGILFVSFFVHNVVLSIMKNQEKPKNNVRDLTIAYALVGCSYAVIGLLGYMSKLGNGDKIPQNILDAFDDMRGMVFAAKLLLMFQLLSVFPILVYIIRVQAFEVLFKNTNQVHVFFLNAAVMTACVFVAIYFAQIGTILRFAGAICGLVYEFMLPIGVAVMVLRQSGNIGYLNAVKYTILLATAVAIFIGQFV